MNTIQKIKFVILLVASLLSSTHIICSDFDAFAFLLETSLIKRAYLHDSVYYRSIFISNEKRQAYEYIRATLARFNAPDHKPDLIELVLGLFLGPNGRTFIQDLSSCTGSDSMQEKIHIILGDKYSKEEMDQEQSLLAQTARYIHETRSERKEYEVKAKTEVKIKDKEKLLQPLCWLLVLAVALRGLAG